LPAETGDLVVLGARSPRRATASAAACCGRAPTRVSTSAKRWVRWYERNSGCAAAMGSQEPAKIGLRSRIAIGSANATFEWRGMSFLACSAVAARDKSRRRQCHSGSPDGHRLEHARRALHGRLRSLRPASGAPVESPAVHQAVGAATHRRRRSGGRVPHPTDPPTIPTGEPELNSNPGPRRDSLTSRARELLLDHMLRPLLSSPNTS
jgi:hypothetical protein